MRISTALAAAMAAALVSAPTLAHAVTLEDDASGFRFDVDATDARVCVLRPSGQRTDACAGLDIDDARLAKIDAVGTRPPLYAVVRLPDKSRIFVAAAFFPNPVGAEVTPTEGSLLLESIAGIPSGMSARWSGPASVGRAGDAQVVRREMTVTQGSTESRTIQHVVVGDDSIVLLSAMFSGDRNERARSALDSMLSTIRIRAPRPVWQRVAIPIAKIFAGVPLVLIAPLVVRKKKGKKS